MQELLWSVGSAVAISLMSLVGVFSLFFREKLLNKLVLPLVGFSAGALMGGAFIHLLPEAAEKTSLNMVGLFLLVGFASFYVLERALFWHHCHKHGKCDVHTFTYMSLIGDGVHNFLDGIILSVSYLVSIPVGIATTIAIISHEIPQELGDFAVLVHGGYGKLKAIFSNFMIALWAVLGAFLGYIFSGISEQFFIFLIPFAAGGFIYVAASDLIPELHKEADIRKSVGSFMLFLAGMLFMYVVKLISGG